MSVDELQQEVKSLEPEELAAFRTWLEEYTLVQEGLRSIEEHGVIRYSSKEEFIEDIMKRATELAEQRRGKHGQAQSIAPSA